jgi:hypothetical protein
MSAYGSVRDDDRFAPVIFTSLTDEVELKMEEELYRLSPSHLHVDDLV